MPGLRPLATVLTLAPPHRDAEQEALLEVVKLWRRFSWDRFLVAWCAAFHGLIAFTLACAPYSQIYNAGTKPVYYLANRYVWAALFLAAGLASALLLHRQTVAVQILTWFTVLPLGGAWLTAFALAVSNGSGSAIGVVVWPFLYGPFAIAAIRIGLGKR